MAKDLEIEKSAHATDRENFRKMFKKQEKAFIDLRKENKDLRKKIEINDQINRSIIDDLIQSDKTIERPESEKSADDESESVDTDTEDFMCNICYNSVSKNLSRDKVPRRVSKLMLTKWRSQPIKSSLLLNHPIKKANSKALI